MGDLKPVPFRGGVRSRLSRKRWKDGNLHDRGSDGPYEKNREGEVLTKEYSLVKGGPKRKKRKRPVLLDPSESSLVYSALSDKGRKVLNEGA